MQNIDKPIENLNLSARSYNCLKRNKINFVSQLIELSPDELSQMKNMGSKSVSEIRNIVDLLLKNNTEIEGDLEEPCEESKASSRLILDEGIDIIGLSTRAYNCLVTNGITTVDKLIWLEPEDVENFKNVGLKSYNEIIEHIKNIDENLRKENEQCILREILPEWTMGAIEETVFYYKLSYARSCHIWRAAYEASTNKEINNVIPIAYDGQVLKDLFDKVVCGITTTWNDQFEIDDLKKLLPTHVLKFEIYKEQLVRCEREHKIMNLGDGIYSIKYPSLIDYVTGLENDRNKSIIESRLNGEKLSEIGEKYQISRERVRQLCEKTLSDHPKFKEDKYIKIFKEYDLTLEDFVFIFEEAPITYYYLEIVVGVQSTSKKSLNKMMEDISISNRLKRRIDARIHKDCVLVKGIYVPKVRSELFKHFFINNCIEKTSIDDIANKYGDFLDSYGLGNIEKLRIDNRTYENKLSVCDYTLANMGKTFRYYDIGNENNDYRYFIDTLGISDFMDKEITTLKLFRENIELMEKFDIHDEYELHNLLRKIWDKYGICQVEFGKMPTIKIGRSDEKKQMYDFLVQNAPMTAEDLTAAYEDAYGVRSNVAFANFLKHWDSYYHNGEFKIDFKRFSDEQFDYMKNSLVEDFYSIADVKRIFVRKYPNEDISLINPHNIKLLGYQFYCTYVLKKEISATKYFENLLMEKDVFNIEDFPKSLTTINIFLTVLYEKRVAREIVEFTPHKYISLKRLESVGINKEDMDSYCDSVMNFVGKNRFFTIKSIRNEGFSHPLDEIDFDDWFYSSVLTADLNRFSYVRLGGERLIYSGNKSITFSMFLTFLLEKLESIDVYEFEEYLRDEYGFNISHYSIIDAIRKTDHYYDSIMEKIYIDYNTYFEEI